MARDGDSAGVRPRSDWRGVVPGAGLVAAVLAILVLAGVRQTDSALPVPPAPSPQAPESYDPQPSALPPPLVPEPRSRPVLDPLSRRTLEDPARLARSGGGWTLQLAVLCRKEAAERMADRAGDASLLYVLPADVKGQECFRVCWGEYASREEALRAADLPAPLRAALSEKPAPRRIAEMAP